MDLNISLLQLVPPDIWGLDTHLSLYSLLALSVVSLTTVRKMSIAWSWPFIVKLGVIIIIALLGLVKGPIWLFSLIGWSLFLMVLLLPSILLRIQTRHIIDLNGQRVTETARFLSWYYGGKIGQFWSDWAKAFALYVEGNESAADEILDQWKGEDVPSQLRGLANDYRFFGYALARDWPRILSEYESVREAGGPISNQLCLSASRAYAEAKQFDLSAECLSLVKPPDTKSSVYDLAPTFLQFFCLTGNREKTNELMAILAELKHPLPPYTKEYWLGRMVLANGDEQEARAHLSKALKLAEHSALWQSRLQSQINSLATVTSESHVTDATLAMTTITAAHAQAVEDAWGSFKKAARGVVLVQPVRGSLAVTILMSTILLTFILSYSYSFVPGSSTAILTSFCFQEGMLIPERVRAGEYWRTFTCLFLHLHFLHLLFNLVGLWWFGRIAANIFGTVRFLLIYCASGIVSGLAYVLIGSASPAIGASGAIMGLFGAVAAGIYRMPNELPQAVRKKQLTFMMGLLLLQIVMDQIIPHVGASIHMFGLITGTLLGLVLPLPVFKREARPTP
jgi:rhomboid protease GluP